MSYKTMTAAVATIIALSTVGGYAAPEAGAESGAPSTNILDGMKTALSGMSNHDEPGSIWQTCAASTGKVETLSACIKKWMEDPKRTSAEKQAVADAAGKGVTSPCYSICTGDTRYSYGSCSTFWGPMGGDKNCKALCCPAGAADSLKGCCTAAKDPDCCKTY